MRRLKPTLLTVILLVSLLYVETALANTEYTTGNEYQRNQQNTDYYDRIINWADIKKPNSNQTETVNNQYGSERKYDYMYELFLQQY